MLEWPFLRQIMSRDQFMNILSFFHACDNSVRNDDKLYKVGPILFILLPAWKKAYYPDREICLDESMITFKGRAPGRVYQPNTPNKWGLQAYKLAESNSGYCYNIEIYAGQRADDDVDREVDGVTYATVMRLARPCFGRGHHLYFDNYYTSPQVLGDLLLNHVMPVAHFARLVRVFRL